MATLQQLEANRANASDEAAILSEPKTQRVVSTGPTSSEGRTKVSHNALKTGLTGRTVLLPSDDVAAYQAHVERIFKQFSPVEDEEKRLTHSLADTLWRLERIPSLEAGIYAIGRRELAAQFADEADESVRKSMIEAQIFLTYRRDLNNLSIQESRLRRQYEKDEAELKRLVAERLKAEKDREATENRRWYDAIHLYRSAKQHDLTFDPAEIGFEFSIEEIEARERDERRQGAIRNGRYYEYKKKGYFNVPDKAA